MYYSEYFIIKYFYDGLPSPPPIKKKKPQRNDGSKIDMATFWRALEVLWSASAWAFCRNHCGFY